MVTDPREKESNKDDEHLKGYAHDETLNEDEKAGNPIGHAENEEDHQTSWGDDDLGEEDEEL